MAQRPGVGEVRATFDPDVRANGGNDALPAWKLEDAKAQFSEVVRRAREAGPQLVTVRGQQAVVIVAAEEYSAMSIEQHDRADLVDFLQGLALADLDIEREPDRGRDIEL
ncbi:MAG: type II toxin-antitoxin system prevent-host-death family antitoxin [Alphaproteobacteria bacterium]